MSEIKNGRLDQYGAEPFEQHQFGTAGFEGIKHFLRVAPDLIFSNPAGAGFGRGRIWPDFGLQTRPGLEPNVLEL